MLENEWLTLRVAEGGARRRVRCPNPRNQADYSCTTMACTRGRWCVRAVSEPLPCRSSVSLSIAGGKMLVEQTAAITVALEVARNHSKDYPVAESALLEGRAKEVAQFPP